MKSKSTSSKDIFSKIFFYTSIGFLLGLVSYFLMKVIAVCLVIGIIASWQRNKNTKY